MKKKKLGFLTLATTSLTAIPVIAASCNNKKDEKKNYDQLLKLTIDSEIKKTKEAKDVLKTDISISEIKDVKIEIKSLVPSNKIKTKLIITLTVTEKDGKSLEVIKELDGFKEPSSTKTPETPGTNADTPGTNTETPANNKKNVANENFVNAVHITKSAKSSEFFNNIQENATIYYDFGTHSFFDKEYVKGDNEANKNRVELFHLEDFVPAFGVNVVHPTEADKNINKVTLVKDGNNYSLKFKFGQYDAKTKKTTIFDEVYTTKAEAFEFRTKAELDTKIDTLTLSYPDVDNVFDNQATQDKVKLSDENEKMVIKSFDILKGQGKVKVSFVITTQIGAETLESKIKEVTIEGFKVDNFESQLVGVTLNYPDKQNVTIENIDVTKFTLSKDDAPFELTENATATYKKVENSENKYKGTISVEATFAKNEQNVVKTYEISGFKTEAFNLQTYVDSFKSVTLDPSINKSETSTNSITKDSFSLGEFDKKAVNVEITNGKINEANTSEYILTLTFTDLVNEGVELLTKEFTITGFKAGEEIKHYSNEKVAEFAKAQKLFIVDPVKIEENLENFEKAIKSKKPLIKVKNNKITYADSTITGDVIGLSLNPDLGVISLTHGGKNNGTYVKPYPRVKNNGGIRIIKDESGTFKLQFNLILDDHATVDDVVYEQILFNINK
ncbi:hypothetical protein KQ872_01715 [Mycoplasma sp. ES3225-GEN-MYC]|uniref:variable surface lipoprotein n=1 Tax=Mycoplasma miroungigenitalium TaxID=754515 RepID=UPI001C1139D3|nr:variable surface lipoprotein [Mycoplasma miroungigenitalium]MBU4691677.1 hypothetical protein [Mycoplasma miroungigenitalium]